MDRDLKAAESIFLQAIEAVVNAKRNNEYPEIELNWLICKQ